MTPLPRPAALALAVTVLLSGCSSGGGGQADVPDSSTVVTDPRDYSYLQNATPGSHVHDYWGGRTNVTVLDEESEAWSTCSGAGCSSGMTAAWDRPDDGRIVPQGTRWVNGTFHFTPHEDSDFTSLELWVKTAQDSETRKVAGIEVGVPFSIEVTKEQNDPPHYVLSLWQFEVVAKGADDGVTIRGAYRWDVEAVRGWPLDPYPPHPDRWNGADTLTLLQETRSSVLYQETPNSRSCYMGVQGCPGRHVPDNGSVVPFDASRVEARITGNIANLDLRYHGADTWDYEAGDCRIVQVELVCDLTIDGNADSPYAPQSLWEFAVTLDGPTPESEVWTGTYDITVTAHK